MRRRPNPFLLVPGRTRRCGCSPRPAPPARGALCFLSRHTSSPAQGQIFPSRSGYLLAHRRRAGHLENRSFSSTRRYSFTFQGHPWIANQWLGEFLFLGASISPHGEVCSADNSDHCPLLFDPLFDPLAGDAAHRGCGHCHRRLYFFAPGISALGHKSSRIRFSSSGSPVSFTPWRTGSRPAGSSFPL